MGGNIHAITILERAELLKNNLNFEQERKQWNCSGSGLSDVKKDILLLIDQLESLCKTISDDHKELKISFERNDDPCCHLIYNGLTMSVTWEGLYLNSLKDSNLNIVLWRGHVTRKAGIYLKEPTRRKEFALYPDLGKDKRIIWFENCKTQQFRNANLLADFLMKTFFDFIESETKEKNLKF